MRSLRNQSPLPRVESPGASAEFTDDADVTMTMTTIRTGCLAILFSLALASAVWADAAADFESLFGKDLERVNASPERDDDLALAETFVKAAEQTGDKPELRAILIEKAIDLSLRSPEGATTAAKAIELSGSTGAERLEMLEKVAHARQAQYSSARGDAKAEAGEALISALLEAGDAAIELGDADKASVHYRKAMGAANALKSPMVDTVKARYEHATYIRRIDLQIDAAKRRIKSNSKDTAAATELINLYLIEKDDPIEARKYTFLAEDETVADRVKLASTDASELAEQEHFDLGGWYRELAEKAKSKPSRAAMLRRAVGHYDSYLAVHTADDIFRTKAQHARDTIATELASAGGTESDDEGAIKPGRWVDLLAKTDPEKHARRGDWKKSGDRLQLRAGGMAQIMMPVIPDGSYEVSVKFERDGGTAFGVYLPIGDSGTMAVAGYNIRRQFIVHGLSRVDRQEVNDRNNPSRTDGLMSDLEGAKVLLIKVKIDDDEAAISSTLNGKPIVRWSGPIASLDSHAMATSRNANALGLFSWNSGLVIHSAKMRMTSGSGEWIADDNVREIPAGEAAGGDLAEGLGDAIRRGLEEGRGRDLDELRRRMDRRRRD